MKRYQLTLMGICAASIVMVSGCKPAENGGTSSGDSNASQSGDAAAKGAIATLNPTQGNETRGTVTFTPAGNGLRVVAEITGLSPGEHGFHVHEKGDCSAPDGSSAGGHFNPTSHPHGAPGEGQHHIGDLGNITADDSGTAKLDRVFEFLTLEGPNSIVGRGLIVHAKADDLKSQPTGDAGGRLACGVIELQK